MFPFELRAECCMKCLILLLINILRVLLQKGGGDVEGQLLQMSVLWLE